ncbi:MAG TPA: MATE family efflux transporter, partial [Saprospiraceae bacterium]|nr:MATE family efflux transporter [Saprospiraceae bacterium]
MSQKQIIKVNTSVKGIIFLTLPISLAKLVPELNYLLDSVFLGHLGSKELALAGLTGVYYLIFSAVGFGLNNALLSIMSRRAGEGSQNLIFSTLWHGLAVGTTFALLTIGFTHLFIDNILIWSGVEKIEAEMAAGFLRIRVWGLIFLFAYQMQNAYIISLQKSKYLLFGAVGIAIVNMALNYLLIFGIGGFPKMGFNGAALASVIAEFAGMIIVFLVIKWTKLSKKHKISYQWSLKSKTMLLVFKQGLPLMGQYAISLVAWWIFFILINRNYTIEEQAVSQVMRNLFGLSGIFTWSFGSTANTVLSNLLGQGKTDDFFRIMKKIMKISLTGIASFIILINLFPDIFLALFGQ